MILLTQDPVAVFTGIYGSTTNFHHLFGWLDLAGDNSRTPFATSQHLSHHPRDLERCGYGKTGRGWGPSKHRQRWSHNMASRWVRAWGENTWNRPSIEIELNDAVGSLLKIGTTFVLTSPLPASMVGVTVWNIFVPWRVFVPVYSHSVGVWVGPPRFIYQSLGWNCFIATARFGCIHFKHS